VIQEALQVVGQLTRACITSRRLLRQRLDADRLQVARYARVVLADGARLAEADRVQDGLGRVSAEGTPQAEQLVQHDAEREDVRAMVDPYAPGQRLLGAHVVGRPGQLPGLGDRAEVLDERHAQCTLCDTTNTWVRMKLADETEVVLTGP